MPQMPTLGSAPKRSQFLPVAVTAVVVSALAGGIFWVRNRGSEAPAAPVEAVALPPAQITAPVEVAAAEPPQQKPKGAFSALSVAINGPLESAIVRSEGKEVGTALTQVVNRALVWWVRVPQDLMKGDTLSVLYEVRTAQEPLVHAVRFNSRKEGRTFEAYRYKSDSEIFPRYYQADGSELEERLIDGPLDSWEQVTSLLRDGRKHKGVDYKTPVGSPVKSTFDGVVARKNWNFRGNGNSLEINETGGKGRKAMYLHLSDVSKSLSVGSRVRKGEVIGKSGNTGHSFAPHLHYQLMQGERVIDPFESQKSTRSALPPREKPDFERHRDQLSAQFPAPTLAGN
jgi:murein DD-endopeptidase